MKKIAMLLTLVMVLAFGASVMAADVKIGGEVRYVFNVPADDVPYTQATQVRLKVTANLDENTYAQWYAKDSHVDSALNFTTVYTAQLVHKIAGAGTVAVGNTPDYGTNAFAMLGGQVWGSVGSETNGVSFASEAFNGLSFQAMFAPTKDNSFFGGEVTYALPVLEGSSVGFSANKKGDTDMNWAVFGSAPVGPATVYAEVGKNGNDVDEINVKNIGASVKAGPATLYGEMELTEDAGKTYLQATVPYKGISLNASYQTGDGYVGGTNNPGDDGKLAFWAKISF